MSVKVKEKLRHLEAIVKEKEIALIYEAKLDGKGGVCRVRGKRKIILNGLLPDSEKIELLEDILKKLELGEDGEEREAEIPGGEQTG